jgi:voltage-gated sodium channel
MKITHARLKSWVHSKEFCHSVNYAIIAFAVVLGLETFRLGNGWMILFSILDYFFLIIFTLEILLRIFAEDHPIDFFNLLKTRRIMVAGRKKTEFEITEHGVWNYFDFTLILLSIIGVFGNLFVFPGFFQVGRLFRIFRIVRLLEISDHLKEVEKRIVSIIPTVFSFAILLLILTYIYSIMGMFMFDKKVFASCDFSSIHDSFITLFQVMTLDNWSDVMKDLKVNVHTFPPIIIEGYFISFVILTAIIAFNVFIAVMTSQVQEKLEKDIEEKITEVDNSIQNNQLSDRMEVLMAEIQSLRGELKELVRRGG